MSRASEMVTIQTPSDRHYRLSASATHIDLAMEHLAAEGRLGDVEELQLIFDGIMHEVQAEELMAR